MCLRSMRAMNLGGQCVAATHPDLAVRRPTFPIRASYQRISLSLFLVISVSLMFTNDIAERVIIVLLQSRIDHSRLFDEAPV